MEYAKKNYSHLLKVNLEDISKDIQKARFFIIKSYNEDDVHRSMKYQVWSSTYEGNKRLNNAYMECGKDKIPVFLFFSVNSSGQFVGVCKMTSEVVVKEKLAHWTQTEKWPGKFKVEWIFIKDVPNRKLKHIIVPLNENKPVTISRDTQEIPFEQGKEMLGVFESHQQESSLLDEFEKYDLEERKKKEEKTTIEPFGKFIPDAPKDKHKKGKGKGAKEIKKEAGKAEKKEKAPVVETPAEVAAPPPNNNS